MPKTLTISDDTHRILKIESVKRGITLNELVEEKLKCV